MKRILFYFMILIGVVACSDDDSFTTSRSALLTFSVDTVKMDTVFSTIASTTYTFWAYNNTDKSVRIQRVYLRQRNQTGFRVNVDGSYLDNSLGSEISGLEVRKNDSIRVFVELTSSMNSKETPQEISDDLVFQLESGAEQRMHLLSYAWDAIFIRDLLLKRDTLIESSKPLVVYGGITVDTLAKLTIKNTSIYFHDKAGINVYGKLITDSVLMRGDRLDHLFSYLPYDRVSGQWGGLRFYGSSTGNVLYKTEIRNSMFGVRCDSAQISAGSQRIYMERCVVHNCKGVGVESYNSNVAMVDCQLTNMLGDCLLAYGGTVLLDGCTIAQFYPFSASRGVALRFVNTCNGAPSPMELSCVNSILTGYADDELMGKQEHADTTFNYYFSNCLLRTPEVNDASHFKDIIWEKPSDEIQGKKHFKVVDETNFIYDFHLIEESPAKGKGCYR